MQITRKSVHRLQREFYYPGAGFFHLVGYQQSRRYSWWSECSSAYTHDNNGNRKLDPTGYTWDYRWGAE